MFSVVGAHAWFQSPNPREMKLFYTLLLLLTLLPFCVSQIPQIPPPPTGPQEQLEFLTPIFFPVEDVNFVTLVLFPFELTMFEAPIVVRYALFFGVARYDLAAACHPKALSFFGTRDNIPPEFCAPLPAIKIIHYIFHRILTQEFPGLARNFAIFLRTAGLDPDNLSTDETTEVGWANKIAFRAMKYFADDGWNSLGDRSRDDFRQPYSDYTGYIPVNLAQKPVSKLRKPLRWQPLVQPAGPDKFSAQVHVLPHLGFAKPLALTKADLKARVSKQPYNMPNRRGRVGKKDRAFLERLIKNYFRISRKLTDQQRIEAAFWDIKLISVGTFLPFYDTVVDITSFEQVQWTLSEMIAQHDAVLVAWREKRRHDLIRPTTIIRRLWKGRTVRAFVNNAVGVKRVKVEEFEPLIKTQPHSEFPSGSALLCAASFENLKTAFSDKFGRNFTEPPFDLRVTTPSLGFLPEFPRPFTLRYESLQDAAEVCGRSRLYAGVHFPPSVNEALRLGQGIGERAFRQINALVRGRVPENCARCLRDDE